MANDKKKVSWVSLVLAAFAVLGIINLCTDNQTVNSPPASKDLSTVLKQHIFYELVVLQDEISIWDSEYQEKNQKAKEIIAKQ